MTLSLGDPAAGDIDEGDATVQLTKTTPRAAPAGRSDSAGNTSNLFSDTAALFSAPNGK